MMTLACRPPCGVKEFTGGEATITLTITEPEEVETTWTVRGGTKEDLELSFDAANDFINPGEPGDIEENANTSYPRGPDKEDGSSSFRASLPTDEIPGLGCTEGLEVTGFEVMAAWDDDSEGGGMEVWGPEHDFYEPIAAGHGADVEVAIDSKTRGSMVARDIVWQRIVGDDFQREDCPERATLTVSWELDRSTRVVDADRCDISIFD
jgi:hypothetical protein